jgi:hypothetical protein
MKAYTGIGSRETPIKIQKRMKVIAEFLSSKSFILRSGGAIGADSAFESGATHKEVYLPWDGFNGKVSDNVSYFVPDLKVEYINKFHPAASSLKKSGILLMNRNTYQILGRNLNKPSHFVVCWTKDGKDVGGTSQALRIAKAMNIPIFNLWFGFESFVAFCHTL